MGKMSSSRGAKSRGRKAANTRKMNELEKNADMDLEGSGSESGAEDREKEEGDMEIESAGTFSGQGGSTNLPQSLGTNGRIDR